MMDLTLFFQNSKMSVLELADEFDESAMSLSLIESGFRHTGNASETSSQVDINDL